MLRLLIVGLTLASAALFVIPAGRAAAAVDISGQWSLALTHPDFTGTIFCAGPISQGGTALSSQMTCDFFGSVNLSGSINTTTGAFTLSGTTPSSEQLNFQGTATADGDGMSGSWVLVGIPAQGSFNGTRTLAVGGLTELTNVGAELSNGGSGSRGVWHYLVVSAAILSLFAGIGVRRLAARPARA